MVFALLLMLALGWRLAIRRAAWLGGVVQAAFAAPVACALALRQARVPCRAVCANLMPDFAARKRSIRAVRLARS
ncbi:MAG: hypothetical protein IT449_09565 [Phycisphaerales bacterium]|nr:hypothetical protein [Phycisphaerales bacterium]